MSERVHRARDLLIEEVAEHAKHCTAQQCEHLANLLAFLAHSIGATRRDMLALPRLLAQYDLECQGCASPRHAAPAQPWTPDMRD
jgi:hypothetical protein